MHAQLRLAVSHAPPREPMLDPRQLYVGGALAGRVLRGAGLPAGIDDYRFVGIATLHGDSCALVWARECFSDETARQLAREHLDAVPDWLEIAPSRFVVHDDPCHGTTYACTMDPTRVSVLWHSSRDAPIATVASHELMRILLGAEWGHDAAVDLVEAFARTSSIPIRGTARWALIEEALAHVEQWMRRLGAAGCR